LLLPVVLFAVLRLVNTKDLMGPQVNGPIYNAAAWLTAIVVTVLSLLYIVISLFPHLFSR
jgi:Mn2+/Fe2+ NRAMP family transporter